MTALINKAMTPKEKAYELVYKTYWYIDTAKICDFDDQKTELAKTITLQFLDEILKTVAISIPYINEETTEEYWEQVKQEIKKL